MDASFKINDGVDNPAKSRRRKRNEAFRRRLKQKQRAAHDRNALRLKVALACAVVSWLFAGSQFF